MKDIFDFISPMFGDISIEVIRTVMVTLVLSLLFIIRKSLLLLILGIFNGKWKRMWSGALITSEVKEIKSIPEHKRTWLQRKALTRYGEKNPRAKKIGIIERKKPQNPRSKF